MRHGVTYAMLNLVITCYLQDCKPSLQGWNIVDRRKIQEINQSKAVNVKHFEFSSRTLNNQVYNKYIKLIFKFRHWECLLH